MVNKALVSHFMRAGSTPSWQARVSSCVGQMDQAKPVSCCPLYKLVESYLAIAIVDACNNIPTDIQSTKGLQQPHTFFSLKVKCIKKPSSSTCFEHTLTQPITSTWVLCNLLGVHHMPHTRRAGSPQLPTAQTSHLFPGGKPFLAPATINFSKPKSSMKTFLLFVGAICAVSGRHLMTTLHHHQQPLDQPTEAQQRVGSQPPSLATPTMPAAADLSFSHGECSTNLCGPGYRCCQYDYYYDCVYPSETCP